MKLISIGYAALCVVVPIAWGLLVYWSTSLMEKRLSRKNASPSNPAGEPVHLPIEYHI